MTRPSSTDDGSSDLPGLVDPGDGRAGDGSERGPDADPAGVDDARGDELEDDLDGGFDDDFDDDLDDGGAYQVRPLWARTSTLVVIVVTLFVVSGAVTAWLRISDLQQRLDSVEEQTLATEEARQAAILLARDLATYDYRDLGGNFRHVAANATPRFTGQLDRLTEELGPELQQTRAVATAEVRSAGVVRADLREAVVAVFVDQTVSNTKSTTPRVERSRMELTLLREDGVWRLDQAGEL